MAEYPVQDHPDALFLGVGAQIFKRLPVPQKGIDFTVVRRVVPVVGMGFKNGVQIQAGDP